MRIARTLSLSLMRETLLYVGLAFAVLALVLLAQNLLRRLDQLFVVGATAADLFTIVRCILPVALAYALPFAFLIGLVLTFRRLAADRELDALRASGLGPLQLLVPFLLLGLGASLLSGWLSSNVEHRARHELRALLERAAARGAIVEAGKFRHTGPHTLFVEDRTRDGALFGVMIYDQTRPDRRLRIFAERGQMAFDPEARAIRLQLEQGEVHVEPRAGAPQRYQRIRFEAFAYVVDLDNLLSRELLPVRPKQMSETELHAVLDRATRGDPLVDLDVREPVAYALELHRRRAQPWAPLLFAGLGVPIALATERRHRHLGLFGVLGAALAYYALGAAGESLAEAGRLSARAAAWAPNLVGLLAALSLIVRARDPKPR